MNSVMNTVMNPVMTPVTNSVLKAVRNRESHLLTTSGLVVQKNKLLQITLTFRGLGAGLGAGADLLMLMNVRFADWWLSLI